MKKINRTCNNTIKVIFLPETNYTYNTSCNEIDSEAQNQPFWPVMSTNYSIDNGSQWLVVPCSNHSADSYAVCYSPLVVDGLTCVFSCPLPSLSDSEYENAKIMQGVVSWISWVFFFFFSFDPIFVGFLIVFFSNLLYTI